MVRVVIMGSSQCFAGADTAIPKLRSAANKSFTLEGHDRLYLSIDGRFQHQFIAWIVKLWPPSKVWFYWLGQSDQAVHKISDFGFGQ